MLVSFSMLPRPLPAGNDERWRIIDEIYPNLNVKNLVWVRKGPKHIPMDSLGRAHVKGSGWGPDTICPYRPLLRSKNYWSSFENRLPITLSPPLKFFKVIQDKTQGCGSSFHTRLTHCCLLWLSVRGGNQEKRSANTRRDRTIRTESQNLGFSLSGLRVAQGLKENCLCSF